MIKPEEVVISFLAFCCAAGVAAGEVRGGEEGLPAAALALPDPAVFWLASADVVGVTSLVGMNPAFGGTLSDAPAAVPAGRIPAPGTVARAAPAPAPVAAAPGAAFFGAFTGTTDNIMSSPLQSLFITGV